MTEGALPNDSRLMAVELIGPGVSVLELGCGDGPVSEQLVGRACTVTGVELRVELAESARRFCTEVHVADLDTTPLTEVIGTTRFDRILAGDVLEHLRDPGSLLSGLVDHLEPEGFLVATLPNVTHSDVRLMLLSGEWRPQEAGLLDRTHLHLYDRRGVLEMFHDHGWRVDRMERTVKPPLGSELAHLLPDAPSDDVLQAATAGTDADTYQFVVVARPGTPDEQLTRALDGSDEPLSPSPHEDTEALRRLLAENEYLRIRVRELEERLEDLQWTKAEHAGRRGGWLSRLRAAAVRS